MRTLVVVGLLAGAVAVFAPDQGAGLMRSVVHGLGVAPDRPACLLAARRKPCCRNRLSAVQVKYVISATSFGSTQ